MNRIALWLTLALTITPLAADDDAADSDAPEIRSSTLSGLGWRSLGPALMSGRIADVAIDPEKSNTWYVAAGSGNLWKTENAGTTWKPIFENYASYSIGCVAIDPSQRFTIWVGTGEAVGGRHVGFGDGVYRSLDGGDTFQNVGLKETEHIAKILVDPRDSRVVYVAAQGPLWAPGGQRGLYKSTDGGEQWKQILAKGPYTGVTDIAFDPRDPDVLYACTHQRHRTVAALINGGPESGIFKSLDGGEHWRELKQGLPAEDKGKIAIAVSPQQPDVVYASIELAGRTGGFWRSDDGGASWSKRSDFISGGTGPHYYQEIWPDPHRFDVVYQADVNLARTEDGGRSWRSVESRWKHVDNHAVAFHPQDPDFLLVGCDGGLYRSYDQGRTYQFCANLPLTQFYKLSLDNDIPFYHVVGGTQDNSTQWGPTRTNNDSGILNCDWRSLIGGDGHDCAIDPEDPDTIYCESQQGNLRRYDRRTGTSIDIQPQPGPDEEALRFNWDSPILISPHAHTRLYFGSNRLHRSDDRGDSWTAISPDLTRDIDRYREQIMERVWSIDAIWDLFAMSQFSTITSISESPLQEGLIYVGTDDGLIQVTEDGGRNWRKVEKIYGIPEFAFVNDIKADLHDVDTVYAVFDNHKTGDLRPFVLCSRDRGRTWNSIVGDLPERHLVWRIVQDHVKPELLFAGTEFGVFCTLDGGQHWIKLAGNVPTIPFRDLEIQQREDDLVGATFGRGFYVLDDYSPLRAIDQAVLKEPFTLFPIKTAKLYLPARRLGGVKGSQGDAFFNAPNPPYGAVFTYYQRESLKTRKQIRRQQEAEARKAGGDNPYPGFDELKREDREQDPAVVFTIHDADGQIVRKVTGSTAAGIHRLAWDLRYASVTAGGGRGPLVTPGTYTVTVTQCLDDVWTTIGPPQTFEVASLLESAMPLKKREEILRFQKLAGELQRTVVGTRARLQEGLDELTEIQKVLRQTDKAEVAWIEEARSLELQLLELRERLVGDAVRSRHSQVAPPSILRRASLAYEGSLNSFDGPTKTHRQSYEIANTAFQQLRKELVAILEKDLARLKSTLDQAAVPWTAGRGVPALEP